MNFEDNRATRVGDAAAYSSAVAVARRSPPTLAEAEAEAKAEHALVRLGDDADSSVRRRAIDGLARMSWRLERDLG